MKSIKGISLTILIITIMVMVILLGVITANISAVGEESMAMQVLNEMSIIKTKVMTEQYNANTIEGYILQGTQLTSSNSMIVGDETYPNGSGLWYKLTTDDLQDIGVKNIDGTYIVDYTTGEVVSVNGVYVNDVAYYTYETISRAINLQQ